MNIVAIGNECKEDLKKAALEELKKLSPNINEGKLGFLSEFANDNDYEVN
jgi:hypothetical protein